MRCGNRLYCPGEAVSFEEMEAVFGSLGWEDGTRHELTRLPLLEEELSCSAAGDL